MATGKSGKNSSNSDPLPEKQAEKAGSTPRPDHIIFGRESFRDVLDLRIDFMNAPAHLQKELFDDMYDDAKKHGIKDAYIGFGTDERGHWLGWVPLH